MNENQLPLSDEALKTLLSAPEEKPKRRSKAKGPDTKIRDYLTWFKLETHFNTCTNPDCIDPRITAERPRHMVAEIENVGRICRYCFLSGYGLDKQRREV